MLNVMACLIIPLASLHDDLVLLSSNLRKKSLFLTLLLSPTPCGNLYQIFWNIIMSFHSTNPGCVGFFFLRFWSSLSFLYRYFSSGVLSQGHTCACFQSSLPSIFLLIVLLFPLYLWVITFFHCCDKVPNKSNCRKEGSVWVHFLKLRYIVASWQEGTVAGARGGWILSLRQVGSSIKKSQEINSRTWNPFILFIQAKDLRAWTGVGQTDSDLTLATYVMGLTSRNLI